MGKEGDKFVITFCVIMIIIFTLAFIFGYWILFASILIIPVDYIFKRKESKRKVRSKTDVGKSKICQEKEDNCPNCNIELKYPYIECDLCGWRSQWYKKHILRRLGEFHKQESKETRNRRIPKSVQREVWRRDQGRCVECGFKEKLEFDHIIPFSKGRSNTARNIQLLCENCNRKKHNKIGF